jgi:hypothetical protein
LHEDFIANETKANSFRPVNTIDKEHCHSLLHIAAQLLPVLGLGGDSFGQATRYETTINSLIYGKDDFIHSRQYMLRNPAAVSILVLNK